VSGGHWQWRPKYKANATAAEKAKPLPDIMMLTSDIALLEDPKYLELVKLYANDLDALNKAFGNGARTSMQKQSQVLRNMSPLHHHSSQLISVLPCPSQRGTSSCRAIKARHHAASTKSLCLQTMTSWCLAPHCRRRQASRPTMPLRALRLHRR
jgi:catalase (peroxidase I)